MKNIEGKNREKSQEEKIYAERIFIVRNQKEQEIISLVELIFCLNERFRVRKMEKTMEINSLRRLNFRPFCHLCKLSDSVVMKIHR